MLFLNGKTYEPAFGRRAGRSNSSLYF